MSAQILFWHRFFVGRTAGVNPLVATIICYYGNGFRSILCQHAYMYNQPEVQQIQEHKEQMFFHRCIEHKISNKTQ